MKQVVAIGNLVADGGWTEDSEQSLVSTYLARAMDEFHTNRLSTRLIHRLSVEVPGLFMVAARSYLSSSGQSSGLRFLTSLVLRQESAFEFLTSPNSVSRVTAIHLFKRFLQIDPSIDVKLAERLPNRWETNFSEALDSQHATRALDILDETSRGPRLIPLVNHLPSSRDTRLSAKATLFVGRRLHNPAWVRQQMNHTDARVRANALESLWTCNSAASIQLLEECVEDSNNRVWGNAMLGLHRNGRSDAEQTVLKFASAGEYRFRCTAAWVMGKIASQECVQRLAVLVKDDDPRVRSTALHSLLEIRRMEPANSPSVAVPPDSTPWPVEPVTPSEQSPTPVSEPHIEVRLDGSSFRAR